MDNQFSLTIFNLPAEKKPTLEWAGSEEASILILLTHHAEAVLDEFLAKIFVALDIRVDQDAFRLYGMEGSVLHFQQLDSGHRFRHVVSFGVPFEALGLRFRYQLWHPVALGGRTFLYAAPLADIHRERSQGGKEKALLLWNALRQMFPNPEKK